MILQFDLCFVIFYLLDLILSMLPGFRPHQRIAVKRPHCGRLWPRRRERTPALYPASFSTGDFWEKPLKSRFRPAFGLVQTDCSMIFLSILILGISRPSPPPSPRWRHFDVIFLFRDGVKVMSSLQCGVTMMSVFRIGRRNPIHSLKSPFWAVRCPPKVLLKWLRFEARYGFRAIRFQASAISPESDSGNRPPEEIGRAHV